MPLKLNIPEAAVGKSVLWSGFSRVRGREARLRRVKENEADIRSREAQLQIVMICQSLWAGFWFQFVIGVLYDLPALYTLSGGVSWVPQYEFFLKSPGSIPFSMAENFVFYSAIGSAMAVIFGWIFTRGVAAKWRLRSAVVLFVTITLGWSIAAYSAEDAAWNEGLDNQIERARAEWRWAGSGEPWWAEYGQENEYHLRKYRLEVERLEGLKKSQGRDRN